MIHGLANQFVVDEEKLMIEEDTSNYRDKSG